MRKTHALYTVLLMLLMSSLACEGGATASSQTPIVLTTIITATASPLTPTASPVNIDRETATSSGERTSPTPTQIVQGTQGTIIEVTPCGASICEVGPAPTMAPPGVVVFESGIYTPSGPQNVRGCAGMECLIIGSLAGLVPIVTQGKVYDSLNNLWLCQLASSDGIAQICDKAVLYLEHAGRTYGNYIKDN